MPEHSRLPSNARPNAIVHQQTQTIYQGPLPQPDDFAAYERVLPGAADRILKIAETQSAHRQSLERFAVQGDFFKAMMGTVLAYITFAGSMFGAVYLLVHDKPIQSLAALITALGAAFGPKSTSTSSNPSHRNRPLPLINHRQSPGRCSVYRPMLAS